MSRQALAAFAVTFVFGAGTALAQTGDLSGVTMRVLDDLRDVDAVVLELDADRGEAEEGAASEGRAPAGSDERGAATAAQREERSRDAAARDDAAEAAAKRNRLHDVDADERAEGRLEDRDVERSTQPPPAAPVP